MTRESLVDFIVKLSRIFERRVPSDEVMDIWYQELEFINELELQVIYIRIKKEESWPRNFPEKVKAIYRAIRPTDSWVTPSGCYQCQNGILNMVKDGGSYAFRCANCLTDPREAIPKARKSELLAEGYAIHWTMGTAKQIRSMPAHAIGKEFMPEGIMSDTDKIGNLGDDWRDQF